MNLHTVSINAMKSSESFEKRYEAISAQLHTVLNKLDDLLEDPLFIDNIHGEQEIALDQATELIEAIIIRFEPTTTPELRGAGWVDDSYDAN